jgi:Double zinc ribbon
MLFALFGISNDALNLVVNLLVLALVVVYFALVAWTYFDAKRRMQDPVLVASSVGASFVFPFIGTVVYSILRPPEFLDDQHERELEIRAAELRVKQLTEQSCPKCEFPVEKTFLRCPSCRARLKDPCTSCGKPVDPRWALCPYCETPIQKAAPERRAASREKSSREREAKPSSDRSPRERPSRERPSQPRPAGEGRRSGAGSRGSSEQAKRPAEQQPRKAGTASGRRTPARAGSADKSEQREDKRESGSRSSGGKGEERPRPATAS